MFGNALKEKFENLQQEHLQLMQEYTDLQKKLLEFNDAAKLKERMIRRKIWKHYYLTRY